MTGFFRDWVCSLTGAAVVCSVAAALVPAGRWKRIVSFVCGLVMISALISPILSFDADTYGSELARYDLQAEAAAGKSKEITDSLNRKYIEQKCGAYILDKAGNEGAALTASVTARWDTGGWWYPYEVSLSGSVDAEAKLRLEKLIEADLGIPEERQHWSAEND